MYRWMDIWMDEWADEWIDSHRLDGNLTVQDARIQDLYFNISEMKLSITLLYIISDATKYDIIWTENSDVNDSFTSEILKYKSWILASWTVRFTPYHKLSKKLTVIHKRMTDRKALLLETGICYQSCMYASTTTERAIGNYVIHFKVGGECLLVAPAGLDGFEPPNCIFL